MKKIKPLEMARLCNVGLAVLALSGRALTTHAGPLRDWLLEHRATSRTDSVMSSMPNGVQVLRDIVYGSDRLQKMDVYLPAHAESAPVLFMVHGGAWRTGDKGLRNVVENKAKRWLPRGFIFVSVNYRLLPGADPLLQAGDVAKALAVAQSRAKSWGGDPDKFILLGHSAGAHLVALLAANPALALRQGAKPWLGTVSLDSAALDVSQIMQRHHLRLYDNAFGQDPGYWRTVSPAAVLAAGGKPMLMVCSTRRTDGSCAQAKTFTAKAESLGVRAQVLEQDKTHEQINEDLGKPEAYTLAVEAFLRSLDGEVSRRL